MATSLRIKDTWAEQRLFVRRAIIVGLLVFGLSSLVVARLTQLQIFQYDYFSAQSQGNQIRVQPTPPQRGLIFDRNGNAGPTVWVDGRVVGGWAQLPDGEIRYRLLDRSAEGRQSEIDAAAERLRSFYGETRHRVRFPAPLQRELLS